MGVPKFYRWISERYPKINQIISDLLLMPEFDNLYLDMNGIIHHCTHPNDDDLAAALSEKDVMLGIFNYIDRIVTQIAKPTKVLFMAIDGVAPRAKLNQQRSRRFASAKDREVARQAAEAKSGDVVDTAECFDSNCITPGTSFMQRVSEHLKYFIRKKQHEDPLWKRLTIIFSGHEVPGEGEHKIMQYIREIRAHPSHNPDTSHCMYGQDADLIMLGLVSHEPHFTLLREVINFNQNRSGGRDPKNVKKVVVKQSSTSEFQLLHISILREYLQIELCQDLYLAQAPINLERVIDDFVFMTFLVGNDFLPHLPSLDISEGAFDRLFNTYKQQLGECFQKGNIEEGYLTLNGSIPNFKRLENFLVAIGAMEDDIFKERAKTEAEFTARRRKYDRKSTSADHEAEDNAKKEIEDLKSDEFESALQTEKLKLLSLSEDNQSTSSISQLAVQRNTFEHVKGKYYFEKFGILPNHVDTHEAIRSCYLEGLLWCLGYYYRGCLSWTWFFPFHYGPMMSDMVNLEEMISKNQLKMKALQKQSSEQSEDSSSYDYGIFVKGKPFLPFQQLLGCLPAASKNFLPKAYQFLMDNPASPIIDFYPKDFKVDMNGKRNPWEGVNLLPFIDSSRMADALAKYCPPEKLTKDELSRNSFGDPIEFYNDESAQGVHIKSVNPHIGLPDLSGCRIKTRLRPDLIFDRTDIAFEAEIKRGCTMPFAGFPSLHVLPIPQASLKPIKLNCFGSESRYSTFVLTLPEIPMESLPPLEVLSQKMLGSHVFVNWPMMHEARIVGVSNQHCCYKLVPKSSALDGKGKGATPTIIGRASKKVAAAESKSSANNREADEECEEELVCEKFDENETKQWLMKSSDIRDEYIKGRGICGGGGVDIGPVNVRLMVCPLQGMMKDHLTGARKKVFSSFRGDGMAELPMQIAIWHNPTLDSRFVETGPLDIKEIAPLSSEAVVIHPKYCGFDKASQTSSTKKEGGRENIEEEAVQDKHHGRLGYVLAHNEANSKVVLKMAKYPPEPSFGIAIASSITERYFPTGAVAGIVGLRPDILGRVLGSLIVDVDKSESYDLGLRLKVNDFGTGTATYLRVLGYMRVIEDGSQKVGAASSESTNAWVADRDSVRIIGSAGNATGVVPLDRSKKSSGDKEASSGGAEQAPKQVLKWEISVKAVTLLKAYMTKFPQMFAQLSNMNGSDRFIPASQLFSYDPRGHLVALSEVVEWLSTLEVMRLPRAPLSTDALCSDAVKAIQKAADVRTAAFASSKIEFESLSVPLSSLTFAPNLNTMRDVKFNYNKNMGGPELGDRVVNIHDTAVPFGVRGTVVARHFHSSAVEVVFDEVFVGGSTLQGMCDKFRGRLVPWKFLLKIPSGAKPTPTPTPVESKAEPSLKNDDKKKSKETKKKVPVAVPVKVLKPPAADDDDEEVVMVSPSKKEEKKKGAEKKSNEKKDTSAPPKASNQATTTAAPKAKQANSKKGKPTPAAPATVPPPAPVPATATAPAAVLSDSVRKLFVGFEESSTVKASEISSTTETSSVTYVHETISVAPDSGEKDVAASAALLSMLKDGDKGAVQGDDASAALLSMLKDGNKGAVQGDDASAALLSMLKDGDKGAVQGDGASAALLSMLKDGDKPTDKQVEEPLTQRKMYREAKRPEDDSVGFGGGRGKSIKSGDSNGPAASAYDPLQELLANAQFDDYN